MTNEAYQTYIANKAATKTAAKKRIACSRALNLGHTPILEMTKNGKPMTKINGYDKDNRCFKAMLFGDIAVQAVNTLTVGDFVEFVGFQEEIPAEYRKPNCKAEASIVVDAAARGSFKVLSSSQEKAVAREERQAAKAKSDLVFQAKAPSALQAKVQGAYLSRD